ncbi:hypothetical protein BJ684DRAFT_20258 [Piptocephalis cylindrospora]|uniref:BTB domain-containing protein n=1 Tax=Piptocephalis cylindrospora TaxID=1907219 RepID=A0A4P9Y359_9FUNG|nr:hypothetical protein BJ684DRAFT_20258 [Piptocephalis cylindrospora]|eukprot:RKP13233.1 hypothetical protein BJ684DRAFT_20258 [Piptocephalis cylindrospora]
MNGDEEDEEAREVEMEGQEQDQDDYLEGTVVLVDVCQSETKDGEAGSGGNLGPQRMGQHFVGMCGERLVVWVTRCVQGELPDSGVGVWTLGILDGSWQWRREYGLESLMHRISLGSWHYGISGRTGGSLEGKMWVFGSQAYDGEEYMEVVAHLDVRELGVIRDPEPTLGLDLEELLVHGENTDLVILAGEDQGTESKGEGPGRERQCRRIPVHRAILQSRWPHLGHLLAAEGLEASTGEIRLPEAVSSVRGFLYYLYTDILPVNLDTETMCDLMLMGHMYCLTRLQGLCVSRLFARCEDPEGALLIWMCADRIKEGALGRRAMSWILAEFGRIVRTEMWDRLSQDGELMRHFHQSIPSSAQVVWEGGGDPGWRGHGGGLIPGMDRPGTTDLSEGTGRSDRDRDLETLSQTPGLEGTLSPDAQIMHVTAVEEPLED